MNKVLEDLQKIGIVPVVVINDAKDAKPLAEALIKGGLPCAEVTFRTGAAAEAISIMTKTHPDMIVGAEGIFILADDLYRSTCAECFDLFRRSFIIVQKSVRFVELIEFIYEHNKSPLSLKELLHFLLYQMER